jgi:hypothetical protein
MDDLNFLFQRQQQERARADCASCPEAREAHRQLAEFYESRIRALTEGRIVIAPETAAMGLSSGHGVTAG